MSKHEVPTTAAPASRGVLTKALEHAPSLVAEPDPIFVLIEDERHAQSVFDAACRATDSVVIGREPTLAERARREAASDAQEAALSAVMRAVPRTEAGMVAAMDLFLERELQNIPSPADRLLPDLRNSIQAHLRLSAQPSQGSIGTDKALADQIDEIFGRWLQQVKVVRKANEALIRAIAKMPWWAQPGPSRLCEDGKMAGASTWSPAIRDCALPLSLVQRNIRPDEPDLRKFWLNSGPWSQVQRQAAYDLAIEALQARRADQKAEMKLARVDVAKAARDNAVKLLYKMEDEAHRLGPSPCLVAFAALAEIRRYGHGDVCFSRQFEVTRNSVSYEHGLTLRNLMPILPTWLAKTAARVIKPGAGPFRHTPVWRGRDETDPRLRFGRWQPMAPAEVSPIAD